MIESGHTNYSFLLHSEAMEKVDRYREKLCENRRLAGEYLLDEIQGMDTHEISNDVLLDSLIKTKRPQIFAESAVNGDGTDWNLLELSILGDVGCAVPVDVFDDGRHMEPTVHKRPLNAELLFIPGALLRSNCLRKPADWDEVVCDGSINFDAYYQLYRRRLLPLFKYANEVVGNKGRRALITIPGLGCGQFAGVFKGQLGVMLGKVLHLFLSELGKSFPNIKAVYYDPYNEGVESRERINAIEYIIRPLAFSRGGFPQLCHPAMYEQSGDNFDDCDLFSVVAWDHVSWPGNDFYGGARATDDGVKAAATNLISKMTGVEGCYDPNTFRYMPPVHFICWEDVVFSKELKLESKGRQLIYS